MKERKAEADQLNQQGQQQLTQGEYSRALKSFQKALALFKQIEDKVGEGGLLNNIGLVYHRLGQYSQALKYYQQALALQKKIGDDVGEGITLSNLGLIYNELGQHAQALESFQKALVIVKQSGDQATESALLDKISDIFVRLNQYTQGLESYQQALTIRKEVGDRAGEGTTLNNTGFIHERLGKYHRALEYYQQALTIRKEVGDRAGEGTTLNNIGFTYNNLSQYFQALEYYQRALTIRKEVGDRTGEGKTLNNIGLAFANSGKFSQALEYFQKALTISKEVRNRADEGSALINIANVYMIRGQYTKTLEYYQEALAIIKEIGDRAGEGATFNNIGSVYERIGKYQEAQNYYWQALTIRREIGDRVGEGISLGNLGKTYEYLDDQTKALNYYQQALSIFDQIGNLSGKSTMLNNIGGIYSDRGQYQQSLEYYQHALTIRKEIGDHLGEGNSLYNIGSIYSLLKQYSQGLKYAQRALSIFKETGNRFGEGQTLVSIGISLVLLSANVAAEANLFNAIEVFESLHSGLIDENKVSLFDTQVSAYRWLQRTLITQNKVEMALEVAERGRARAFVELLATRINGAEKPLPQLTQTLHPTIAQIRQIGKERNSTLVQYSIVDDKTLYVWVVQPEGKVTHRQVDLPQQLSLSQLVDASRGAIGVRGRGNFRIEMTNTDPSDRFKQLHQLLIEPIADLLPTDPNAPVIFVPHRELFLVPFPALQDATGNYLIEKHTILTAPAIQVLDLTRQKRQQVKQAGLRDVLIVGNPTMPKVAKPGEAPEQLKALDGAEREANTIATLFKTKALTGQQATKTAIMPKLSQARIIHLATHGLLEDLKGLGTPGAIALAPSGTGEPNDGLLTANEILDLKLNAELVVLSACDTGRGKITSDSVIGLSRSLILAGTPSVIVSLWSVPDAPTAELMAEFYRNWQEKKLDKAQALRQAMLTIMQRPNAKPRDWAAFTLIGEVN